MVKYMRKNLAHDEDDSAEFEAVIKQLNDQILRHSPSGLPRKAEQRVMMQCLRTSLVKYPDDIRGRRRAKVAREILVNHVYGEIDFLTALKTALKLKKFANNDNNAWSLLWSLPSNLSDCGERKTKDSARSRHCHHIF